MPRILSSTGTGYFFVPSTSATSVTAPIITNMRPVSTQNTLFNVGSGGSTVSNNLNVFGTSNYSNATVAVYLGGSLLGTTTTASNGSWQFPIGILADSSYATLSAKVIFNGNASPFSSNYPFTINAGLTNLPVSIGSNITDANTLSWGGVPFLTDSTHQATNPNPNCCVVDDTHTLSFTLLSTDNFTEFPSNRTELEMTSAAPYVPNDHTINITYEFLLSASSPVNDSFGGGNWCVIGQLQPGISQPCYEQEIGTTGAGDAFGTLFYNGTSQVTGYQATSNLTRGVWHTIDLQLHPSNTTGFIKLWLDGTQVQNYSGVFVGSPPYYWKMGMYRGIPSVQDQTQLIRYRNFQMIVQ